jgi:Zn-dependent M28 family amino/carboxypeptidase
MKLIRAVLPTLALAACATLPPSGLESGELPVIEAERLAQHISILASDEFEGRAPATRGEELTVNYIAQRFREAGLEPGGHDGSWFQEVPLNQYDFVAPPRVSIAVNGAARALTQAEEIALRPSMLNVDRVQIRDAELVFLGYGVHAPERNWDDFKGEDVRGKIGIVLINDPGFETGNPDFNGRAMTYYGRWTYKYEEAARQGLRGLLIVHETEPASYGWATVRNSFTGTTFDVLRENPSEVRPSQEGWIQRDLAVELFRAAGHDFEQAKRAAQTREFRPVHLGGVTFSTEYEVRRREIRTRNVLGILRGTTYPNETVHYGAHWDHLGVGQPDATGDTIYSGAVDNATGTAAVIELARAFGQGPRPQRSIVFAAWTAEERGLLGSEYYAANPVYPLETTVGGFNIDAMQPFGPARDLLVIGYGQSEMEDALERVLAQHGRVVARDPSPEAGYFFRSDHFSLAKRGVPMLYIGSGQDLLEGGTAAGEAMADEYRRLRYHQQADRFDPSWNLEGMAHDVTILHRLGFQLANSRDWPNYRPTSEFRPVRDRSAAARR